MKTKTIKKTEKKVSKISLLESRIIKLEERLSGLVENGRFISEADSEEEKRLRALREKGGIKYGD